MNVQWLGFNGNGAWSLTGCSMIRYGLHLNEINATSPNMLRIGTNYNLLILRVLKYEIIFHNSNLKKGLFAGLLEIRDKNIWIAEILLVGIHIFEK